MTYREIVYLILDEIKGTSDDFTYTEDHVISLLGNYRSFVLRQQYSSIKRMIPKSNYQTLCLDMMEVPAMAGGPCDGGYYLRSVHKIPFLVGIGVPRVYPADYYQGEITYVSRDRMRYVGYNRYLKNIIYASLGPDNYLYLTSANPQFRYLEKVRLTGVFENPRAAWELGCEEDSSCDILDMEFPLEEGLVPMVTEMVIKELLGASYRPEDKRNDANDNLTDVQLQNPKSQS